MRFLFTCIPAVGHLHAMVPYAQALKNQGHDVAFATGRRFSEAVRRAGFNHHACGIDDASSSDVLTDLPEWGAIQQRFAAAPLGVAQLHAFVEVLAPRMLAGLRQFVKTWRPQLIVRDPLEFAGYIAAELADIPHAVVDWAIHIPAHHIAQEALHLLRERQGLPNDPELKTLDCHLVLSAMPPSWKYEHLRYPEALRRYCVAPYDHSVDARNQLPAIAQSGRPVVYATLGTTFNNSWQTFRTIVDALGAEEVSGIVTVGNGLDPAAFGAIPKNVQIARYIPQTVVLPHCDAVLFHAGFNSLHSALWHGLPMLLVPLAAGDQRPNAVQAAAAGVGLIEEQPLDLRKLRQSIQTVLSDPRLYLNAQRLCAEMRALPPLSEAAHRMADLAQSARY